MTAASTPTAPSPNAALSASFASLASNSAAAASGGASSLNGGPKPPLPALRFLDYVNATPTPFHATKESARRLEEAGFTRLREREVWEGKVEKGGLYYFTRNESSLIAFAVGHNFKPGDGGVHVVGAHTDSPNLHIKPVSKKSEKEGWIQCGVETYGGGIWSTWFDRDLSLAGRVIVSTDSSHSSFESRLVHIKRPLLRIPTLAIHLNRTVNEAFKFNQEEHMLPVLGLVQAAQDQLNKPAGEDQPADASAAATGSPTMKSKHAPVLLETLAGELGVAPELIQDLELSLYDTQPAAIGGVNNEFIHSPRLDNQMSCFCGTEALIASVTSSHSGTASTLSASSSIRALALFDNEEVGSVSTHGAESNMLGSLVRRLASIPIAGIAPLDTDDRSLTAPERALSRSFLISSDMAHAYHPNYSSFYEDVHRPRLNGGIVIKTNAKQRYASTGPTTFLLRRVARLADVPLQEFEVRNDVPCGSTIGPMLSKTGIRTVDLGSPQLSMHSIRETAGTLDVGYKVKLFRTFWDEFEKVDQELEID